MAVGSVLDKLKDQKQMVQYRPNWEIWFPKTYAIILDRYDSWEPRARNFQKVMEDYERKKRDTQPRTFGIELYAYDDIKVRASAFLDDIIEVLEQEKKDQESSAKAASERNKRLEQEKARLASPQKQNPAPVPVPQKPVPQPTELEKLIAKGDTFKFADNSVSDERGSYGGPKPELLAWIAAVEHYIIENYGENSTPYKLYKEYNSKEIAGNFQSDFEKQLNIVKGAINACLTIPKSNKQMTSTKETHTKHLFGLTEIVGALILSGGLFWFGYYVGTTKFDKEKLEYYEQVRTLKLDTTILHNRLNTLDSIIKSKDSELIKAKDSLKETQNSLDAVFQMYNKNIQAK